MRGNAHAGIAALSALVGHHDPELTEAERSQNIENGATLLYLACRDIHAVRGALLEKSSKPDLDP